MTAIFDQLAELSTAKMVLGRKMGGFAIARLTWQRLQFQHNILGDVYMKKLLLVVPLALAACSSDLGTGASIVPNLYIATPQGAGLGPYSRAEYHARADDGQPGLIRRQEPWTRADTRRLSSGSFRNARGAQENGGFLTSAATLQNAREMATTTPTTYLLADGTVVTVTLLEGGRVLEEIRTGG